MDSNVAVAQRRLDGGIPFQCGRVIIVVVKQRVDAGFKRQLHDFVAGNAVFHHQATAFRLQGLLQLDHAGVDELGPAIGGIRQRIRNSAIEHEDAHHPLRAFERMVERGMVEIAQLAAKPEQGAAIFRHEAFRSL